MTGWERRGDPGHAAQVRARTLRARATHNVRANAPRHTISGTFRFGA
jgi:hypothetical protein